MSLSKIVQESVPKILKKISEVIYGRSSKLSVNEYNELYTDLISSQISLLEEVAKWSGTNDRWCDDFDETRYKELQDYLTEQIELIKKMV